MVKNGGGLRFLLCRLPVGLVVVLMVDVFWGCWGVGGVQVAVRAGGGGGKYQC